MIGLLGAILSAAAWAQGPENVLLVYNQASAGSKRIADYYAEKRRIPKGNILALNTLAEEEIERTVFDAKIAAPIGQFLISRKLLESILYIAVAQGVPLKIKGSNQLDGDEASVDSELAPLYGDLKSGRKHPIRGPIDNPFFRQRDAPFSHRAFPIFLVTRLAGYAFEDVKAMIDRSLIAKNTGKVVIDLHDGSDDDGNNWLRNAAILLPKDRVVYDESKKVLYGEKQVIAYASFGSNDKNRNRRFLGFEWLPGAIMTEFVSSNGRTFREPPKAWSISTWGDNDRGKWFAGSPQSLTADYLREGVTGASGHVYEPYLHLCPRPDLLLPAYIGGRTLAESYYMAIPALSWKNIVVGDPLCRLAK